MGATQTLSAYASSLRYGDIPPEVIARLKLHLLDAMGATLYGYNTPWCELIRTYWLDHLAGPGEALVWGSARKAPPAVAALVNSTAAHAFELDDRRVASYLHPASATLPAALAVADAKGGLPGRELLTAITAGYEVGLRIGKCMGVGAFARGFYSPGLGGGFTAAATAGRLQGVDAAEMANVFHVTATQSSGLYSPTSMKRLNLGNGTFHGVSAVDLVQRGLTGLPDILEREVGGFCNAFLDNPNLDHLTEGLGSFYETLRVELKPYVSSRPCHTGIDASLALRTNNPDVGPDDIERIEIVINSGRYKLAQGFGDPYDVPSALMNVRYCCIIATLDGEVFLEQFTDEKVHAPAVRKMLAKTFVSCDPSLDAIVLEGRDHTLVRWHLKDGRILEEARTVAKGHPDNPMSEAEIRAKFHRLLDEVVGVDRANEIEAAFDALDSIESTTLQRLLTSPFRS